MRQHGELWSARATPRTPVTGEPLPLSVVNGTRHRTTGRSPSNRPR